MNSCIWVKDNLLRLIIMNLEVDSNESPLISFMTINKENGLDEEKEWRNQKMIGIRRWERLNGCTKTSIIL